MDPPEQTLGTHPIFYVTRDIERALGLPLDTPGYFIISNSTPFAKQIAGERKNILLIENETLLDTHELLEHNLTRTFINTSTTSLPLEGRVGVGSSLEHPERPSILVFKNTKIIERICHDNNWKLVNPPAELASHIEEKITQLSFLPTLKDLFLPYTITTCEQIQWKQKPFVLQFNHSHTGSGTLFIETEEKLKEIQQQFPKREVRVAPFIVGPIFTNNNVVTPDKTLIGNINYQITGLPPFTERPFATIGNDWQLPQKLLTPAEQEEYKRIATAVGDALRTHGWKGLFGIDVLMEAETGKLFLLEINARQPASTTFESKLQGESRIKNQESGITIFEAHVASLLHINLLSHELISINDGAQIIVRNTPTLSEKKVEKIVNALKQKGFAVIEYTNSKPEADRLRIQSTHGFMADHNILNASGQEICEALL